MQTNPVVEQSKIIWWSENPCNQSVEHFLSQLLTKTVGKYLKIKSFCPIATASILPTRKHWIVNWTLIAVWLLTYGAVI